MNNECHTAFQTNKPDAQTSKLLEQLDQNAANKPGTVWKLAIARMFDNLLFVPLHRQMLRTHHKGKVVCRHSKYSVNFSLAILIDCDLGSLKKEKDRPLTALSSHLSLVHLPSHHVQPYEFSVQLGQDLNDPQICRELSARQMGRNRLLTKFSVTVGRRQTFGWRYSCASSPVPRIGHRFPLAVSKFSMILISFICLASSFKRQPRSRIHTHFTPSRTDKQSSSDL